MSLREISFIPSSHIDTQMFDCKNNQSILIKFVQISKESLILPLIDDTQLLSDHRQIDYKIHHGFTSNEENLIKNALQIIADRLFKAEILENMDRICGTTCSLLEKGVWSRSQLENDTNYRGRHNLLRFQLMCLENVKFPTIHIYPIYEKTDTQSTGTIGCVSCISYGSSFSVKGKFDVKLNRYNLNPSNENLGNIVYWAGAIVHEMLHNLGHKHTCDDYSDHWQINVFEQCFMYNGNYSPSLTTS